MMYDANVQLLVAHHSYQMHQRHISCSHPTHSSSSMRRPHTMGERNIVVLFIARCDVTFWMVANDEHHSNALTHSDTTHKYLIQHSSLLGASLVVAAPSAVSKTNRHFHSNAYHLSSKWINWLSHALTRSVSRIHAPLVQLPETIRKPLAVGSSHLCRMHFRIRCEATIFAKDFRIFHQRIRIGVAIVA